MDFNKAIKILGIEDYAERIFKSNSHGELFHLEQYAHLAKIFQEEKEDFSWFRGWFEGVVKYAEENWERPESVFQHILKILHEHLNPLNQ